MKECDWSSDVCSSDLCSLQGIAGGNAKRRRCRALGGDVDQKRSEKHPRPKALAPKKQRRQSQAGGRPDGRGAGVHISEREPELAAAEICRSQGQGLNQEQASGFGGARAQWSL